MGLNCLIWTILTFFTSVFVVLFVVFLADLPEVFVKRFSGKAGKKARKGTSASAEELTPDDIKMYPLVVTLNFKKHVFDPSKRFVQWFIFIWNLPFTLIFSNKRTLLEPLYSFFVCSLVLSETYGESLFVTVTGFRFLFDSKKRERVLLILCAVICMFCVGWLVSGIPTNHLSFQTMGMTKVH